MIRMDKKYRTRDGREVRLLCVDGPGGWPVVGVAGGAVERWTAEGQSLRGKTSHPTDLIEYHEPDIRTIWVNVHEGYVHGFSSENCAKNMAIDDAIAIAQPVTFEVKRNG